MINGLGTGGAERSLAETLPLLRARGVAATVVCLFERAEGVEGLVREAGFDVRVLAATSWLGRIGQLRRMLQRENPDIVHTTIFESDVIGRLAAIGTGSTVVSSLVNTSYNRARARDASVSVCKLWAAKQVDGWTARHLTSSFHSVSEAVREASVRQLHLDPARIRVIERGRDVQRLGKPGAARRADVRKALGLGEDHEVIVNVGRQEFQKGQLDLLRAIEILAARRPKLVLIQAGRRGGMTAELERAMGRPALAGCVRLLGHRDDVPDLLAAADIFAFPSRYEGLGGALIEAMALELPIVTTAVPAVLEVVEPGANALTVPTGDARQLANALESLLDDPERREKFGARSREIFLERFTLARSAHRLLQFYADISNGKL